MTDDRIITITLAGFFVALFYTPIVLGALIPWFNDNDGEDGP